MTWSGRLEARTLHSFGQGVIQGSHTNLQKSQDRKEPSLFKGSKISCVGGVAEQEQGSETLLTGGRGWAMEGFRASLRTGFYSKGSQWGGLIYSLQSLLSPWGLGVTVEREQSSGCSAQGSVCVGRPGRGINNKGDEKRMVLGYVL